jgi:hypothetical protein
MGPRDQHAHRALRQGGRTHGAGQRGSAGFSFVPKSPLAPDLEHQSAQERLNKEIKRRSRVVGIFPNEEAAIRLCGAVVLDINDEWASAERRYFSEASMADLYPPRDDDDATLKELVPAE